MVRLSLISITLLMLTFAQSSFSMTYDPKLGPTNDPAVAIAVSKHHSKKSHVCPYQTGKVCAGGGLLCNTNPATRTVRGKKGQGVY